MLAPDGEAIVFRTNDRDESTFDIAVHRFDSRESEIWLRDGGQVNATDLLDDQALVICNGSDHSNMDGDLLLVKRNGDVRNLTPHDGEQWIFDAKFDKSRPGFWMLSNLDREFVALMYQDLDSGDRRVIFEADWDVEHFAISPDGSHIAVSINEAGYSRPRIISPDGVSEETKVSVTDGVIDQFSWSPDSSSVVFGISTPEDPSVIMISNLAGKSRVVVEADNAAIPLTVTPELISYTTWDGRQIAGLFFRPEGDGPFPALVEIHGGPESQRRPEYGSNGASLQFLTSMGIAVLALNIRGSTGYGKSFCHLDDKSKRLDALKDVEYATKWLRRRDDVIPNKIAVYGISYGGFMTLSALVRYPELWAAGVEMVGMAHLSTFLERTGPWRRKRREMEYGSLETDRDMLQQLSPLPLVDRISAPLMVFHGRQDARVPLHESEQIVESVKQRGLDVVFRIYEDEGHLFTKRPNLIDAFSRIGEFLSHHLNLKTLET